MLIHEKNKRAEYLRLIQSRTPGMGIEGSHKLPDRIKIERSEFFNPKEGLILRSLLQGVSFEPE